MHNNVLVCTILYIENIRTYTSNICKKRDVDLPLPYLEVHHIFTNYKRATCKIDVHIWSFFNCPTIWQAHNYDSAAQQNKNRPSGFSPTPYEKRLKAECTYASEREHTFVAVCICVRCNQCTSDINPALYKLYTIPSLMFWIPQWAVYIVLGSPSFHTTTKQTLLNATWKSSSNAFATGLSSDTSAWGIAHAHHTHQHHVRLVST